MGLLQRWLHIFDLGQISCQMPFLTQPFHLSGLGTSCILVTPEGGFVPTPGHLVLIWRLTKKLRFIKEFHRFCAGTNNT